MRVGIDLLSEKAAPGGIHTYVNEILGELAGGRDGRDDSVRYVVFTHADYRLSQTIESSPLVEVVQTRWRGLPAAARRLSEEIALPRLARLHRIDVMHCVNNVLPRSLHTAAVLTVHDLSPFAAPGRFSSLKERYLTSRVPESVRRATRVVTVSESTRSDILTWVAGASPRRIAVTPLAAGARFHSGASAGENAEIRRLYGLPERYALHVSLIEPGKNLETISRALHQLLETGLEVPLVVAGRATSYLKVLRRLWRDLGLEDRVRYLGEVPASDLPSLYRAARAFVFPSEHEGFGLPLLEAFACGTPSIASTRGALPEVAKDAALLVPSRDVPALAEGLRWVWLDDTLRALLRSRGLCRAQDFSWARCAALTLEAYHAAHSEGLGHAPTPRTDPRRNRPVRA